MLLLSDYREVQPSDAEDHLAELSLPLAVFVKLALELRLKKDVLLVQVIDLFFELLDAQIVLVVECFLGLPDFLDGLRSAFLFVANLPMHVSQLYFLLLHGLESFKDAHYAEVVHVDRPEII